jgi:aminoglycoside phosphotransferase (APT) family kinase protein
VAGIPSGWSREEVAAVRDAVRHGLGEEPASLGRLRSHPSRQVYLVRLEAREVVLKVLHSRDMRALACRYAVDALRAAGIPSPAVLAVHKAGRLFGKPYLIMERAAGLPLNEWLLAAKPDDPSRHAVLEDLGRHLALMHTLPGAGGFGKLDDDGRGRYGSWREYLQAERLPHLAQLRERGILSRRAEERAGRAVARHEALQELDAPLLLHNDLTLKNVFVDPARLRVSAVIDLHNALGGDPVLDVARFEYFYRGRGFLGPLLTGYGPLPDGFDLRQRLHLLLILVEKLVWLQGQEEAFPGRVEKDLELLEETVAALAD